MFVCTNNGFFFFDSEHSIRHVKVKIIDNDFSAVMPTVNDINLYVYTYLRLNNKKTWIDSHHLRICTFYNSAGFHYYHGIKLQWIHMYFLLKWVIPLFHISCIHKIFMAFNEPGMISTMKKSRNMPLKMESSSSSD